MKHLFFLFSIVLIWSCQSASNEGATHQKTIAHPEASLLTYSNHQQILAKIPEFIDFRQEITSALQQKMPIMEFPEKELALQRLKAVSSKVRSHKDFTAQCFLPETNEPLLNMVTDVRPAKAKELLKIKGQGDLVLVEMYNFYYNTVILAFWDESARQVVKVTSSPGKQPNLTKQLQNLATKMALAYPEIQRQLGMNNNQLPDGFDVVVRKSKCERSRHLCAAVTITPKDKKETLWVLIDLTVLKAIGYQWTDIWNPNRPKLVTERSLQTDVIANDYCNDTNRLAMNNWVIHYQLTNSDGVAIFDASYKGKDVLKSAKLVDWHVSYPDKKDFGYSDAMGCPKFSSAAVVSFEPPDIQSIMNKDQEVGFSFIQDFRSPVWPKACNYRYQNLFEFYADGRFRIAGVNLGLGCSNNGWYRPVFRIQLADKKGQSVAAWENNHWQNWTNEQWNLQEDKTAFSPQGYQFKFSNQDGSGYYLEPNQGQFNDGSRGDHAYTFVTKAKLGQGEGELDMPTLGPCCNSSFEQGPEQFMQPAEKLTGQNVIWYVPQMKNSDKKGSEYCWVKTKVVDGHEGYQTYNGVVGPMFVPFDKNSKNVK